jgi:cell division transport system permease protein
MVYLAALAVAATIALDGAIDRWDRGIAGTMTVQLPRINQTASAKSAKPSSVEDVLVALRGTPGVASAQALDRAAQAALLEPWLGSAIDLDLLPVPTLVDVRLAPEAAVDKTALGQRLAAIYPGAVVEDNGRWLTHLMRVAGVAEVVAIAILALIGGLAVLTVVFTTRTGLLIHAGVIELLHLIGARDLYIARQFQWQAFSLMLRGGLAGFVVASLTLLALDFAGGASGLLGTERLIPGLQLPVLGWLALAALPVIVGMIGLVTARITVLRTLAQMP